MTACRINADYQEREVQGGKRQGHRDQDNVGFYKSAAPMLRHCIEWCGDIEPFDDVFLHIQTTIARSAVITVCAKA